MATSTFTILLFVAVIVCADALQCIVGNEYNCTAHDVAYARHCEQLEARNQVFVVKTCLAGQDKCLLFASKLSFILSNLVLFLVEETFDLQLITASCGTGTLDGCNNRQELLAINPRFGQITQGILTTSWNDDFSGPGYEYDLLDVCVCDTDVCVDVDKLSGYENTVFGRRFTTVAGNQLQCITGKELNCTAHDTAYVEYCEQLQSRNTEYAEQTCSEGQDKCLLFASKLSFKDKFDLQLIIAACGTGTLQGCNNRQELLAINPSFGQIDEFSGQGYEYEILDVCVCSTKLCVDENKLSDFQKIIFGNYTNFLRGHLLVVGILMSIGTFLAG
ncbi:hypothetical protein HOLleu_28823 [Holothuria leucospilota]|uniref:Uncharacterized protein n=1 Tax=Holothuria leucospilota TaxID=206669 RepID=A0A9Q1BMR6_HOLLE|nr:hypothetical protein HOLleu_28823 [Holothuria leucospilota]